MIDLQNYFTYKRSWEKCTCNSRKCQTKITEKTVLNDDVGEHKICSLLK